MKKIFTLMGALMLSAMSMLAQSDLVFTDGAGKAYPDGTVITMDKAEVNDFDEVEIALSNVYVKNTGSSAANATMTVTAKTLPSGDFACCLGKTCKNLSEVGSLSINGGSIGGGQSLQITNTEWKPTEGNYGTCTVDFQLSDGMEDGAKITVNFVYSDPTSIKSTATVVNRPVAYYSINGVRIPSLQKGINLVKYSDGSVKKIIRK